MSKENTEYHYEVEFEGVEDREGCGNPAYHLESVMIAFLESFQECGIISRFKIKVLKATKEIDKDGKVTKLLH